MCSTLTCRLHIKQKWNLILICSMFWWWWCRAVKLDSIRFEMSSLKFIFWINWNFNKTTTFTNKSQIYLFFQWLFYHSILFPSQEFGFGFHFLKEQDILFKGANRSSWIWKQNIFIRMSLLHFGPKSSAVTIGWYMLS